MNEFDNRQNLNEDEKNLPQKNYRALRTATIIIGGVIPVLCLLLTAIFIPIDVDIAFTFLILGIMFLIIGLIMLSAYLFMRKKKFFNAIGPLGWPIAALGLDAAAPVLVFLGMFVGKFGVFGIVALFLFLFAFISPIVAIIIGIQAICMERKKIGKAGVAISLAAILIPIIFVIVMIILLSTGVAHIRLM